MTHVLFLLLLKFQLANLMQFFIQSVHKILTLWIFKVRSHTLRVNLLIISSYYRLAHMSNVITYDIWILTFVCLSTDNFLLHLVCLRKLYYLQLFTIIAYHLNANVMLFSYVICNYIWHMGSLYYELILHPEKLKLLVELGKLYKYKWFYVYFSILSIKFQI